MLPNHYYINYSCRTRQDLKKSEAQTLPVVKTFPKPKLPFFTWTGSICHTCSKIAIYISCRWTIQDTKAIIIHTGNKALAEADTCCRLFTGSPRSRASWAVEGWLTPSHTHTTTPVYVPSLLSILRSLRTYLLRYKCTPAWRQPDSRQQMLLWSCLFSQHGLHAWLITKYNLYNITSRSFYKFVFKYCKFSF